LDPLRRRAAGDAGPLAGGQPPDLCPDAETPRRRPGLRRQRARRAGADAGRAAAQPGPGGAPPQPADRAGEGARRRLRRPGLQAGPALSGPGEHTWTIPRTPGTPPPPAAAPDPGRRQSLMLMFGGVLLLAALAWLVYWLIYDRWHESTD